MDRLDNSKLNTGLKPAMLIINPVSGKKLALRYIPQMIRALMDGGYLVTTVVTAKRGDATEFAALYGRQYELICCTGGDGTLNETLTGIARAGIDVPLGYIPCGSTNDFAASHKLSTDILTAAQNIASGRVTRYDIGKFGEQYFSYVAAFGAFSWLSYTTDQNLKNMLGHTAYILDGIKDLPKIKPYQVKLTADGIVHEDSYIFGAICNSTSIAGTIELPESVVNTCDGVFEVLLIKNPKTLVELDQIIRSLLMQDYTCPYVEFFQARNICVENPPDMNWSLDGECSDHCEKAYVKPIPGFLKLQG